MPGPGVADERVTRVVAERERAPGGRADAGEQVACERLDLDHALAQRRQLDRDDAEAVIEVLAKAPGGDGARQIDVGRGENARIHRARGALAEAAELALLDQAQELHLQRQRHVADLVQEQRAAARELDETDAGP